MGWVKAQTTEMPEVLLPSGRPRSRRGAIGTLLALLVIGLLTVTVIFSSSLLHWLRLDPPAAGLPLIDAVPTSAAPSGDPTASAIPTDTPSAQATPTPTPTASPSSAATHAPYATPIATPMPDLENDVLNQTNAARVANKCAPLTMDTHLLTAARLHSADMAENNYFDHIGLDHRGPDARMKAAGYDISAGWAENIAKGYPTADAVMAGWLGSTGHKANILDCAMKSIGIGIAEGPDGSMYWTQDFGGR
jgi:uncharacterized protein YkwD